MNADKVNAKIYAGRGKAALKIGYDYKVMRPLVMSNPLTNQVNTIKAALNAGDNNYLKPNLYGKPIWFADLDGSKVKVGDYLINAANSSQIFFVAAMQSLLPIVCIDCNRSIRLARAAPLGAIGAVGAVAYSGMCDAPAESVDVLGLNPANNGGVFVGWPCSIQFGKGKLKNHDALAAGSDEQMGWQILLPASITSQIKTGDRMLDDSGRMFVVNRAEQTDLGWRLTAIEVHA